MNRIVANAAAAAFGVAAMATPAWADPVSTGQWYVARFGDVGSTVGAGVSVTPGVNPATAFAPDGPWTFTLTGTGGSFTMLDGFNTGDQFAVSDFGVLLGATSVPGMPGGSCGNDVTVCLNNPTTSKGVFTLGAGAHSISVTTLMSVTGQGAAFFLATQNASGAVPEPATWAMMVGGLGLVGASLRRRRVRVAFG